MRTVPVICGFVLEYFLGYSRTLPHPVVFLGRLVSFGEKVLRRFCLTSYCEVVAGGVLTFTVVVLAYTIPWLLLNVAHLFSTVLYYFMAVFLVWTSLATHSLVQHLTAVALPLKEGRLVSARSEVGKIVGRDTLSLSKEEVARAAVETGAESLSDGVVAPLFYAFLGGAPLAWAYKAINTLDSMIGYQNDRYFYLGKAAARLDDLANYLPARLTALFLLLVGAATGLDYRRGWQVLIQDSSRQPSPNSGYPEAAVAGLLNLRLGGASSYQGKTSYKAYLNEEGNKPSAADIYTVIKLIRITSILFLLAGIFLLAAVS